jgi:hypothetical protein
MAIKCGGGYGAFQQPRGGNLASDRVQRRLTAILAADVEGYSRLMGKDEVATLDALTARREILDGLRTQRWIILGGNVTFHNLTGSRQVTNLGCRD